MTFSSRLLLKDIRYDIIIQTVFPKHSVMGEYALGCQAKLIRRKIQILSTLNVNVTTCKIKTEDPFLIQNSTLLILKEKIKIFKTTF